MPEPSLEERVAHLEGLVGAQQFELERKQITIDRQGREIARLRDVLIGLGAVAVTARPIDLTDFATHVATADS